VAVLAQQTWEDFTDSDRNLVKTIDTTADLNAQLKQAGFSIESF
jgi:hypothetical protein